MGGRGGGCEGVTCRHTPPHTCTRNNQFNSAARLRLALQLHPSLPHQRLPLGRRHRCRRLGALPPQPLDGSAQGDPLGLELLRTAIDCTFVIID